MNAAVRARPFELHVVPSGNGYGLKLNRRKLSPSKRTKTETVIEVSSKTVRPVVSLVLDTVKESGYSPGAVTVSRKTPFMLEESAGVRLGLLLLALAPMSNSERIQIIADYVRGMSEEEAFYWYSKTTTPVVGRRALKAFRTMLAD